MFRADLLGSAEASWEELFAGYTALKAITFSSSLEMMMRLADRLADMEVVFGSESILSKEHLALAQASQTIQSYGFSDALIDQKALVEALSRFLGHAGSKLLERVIAGTLRFRLLRGRPSHEKLYLLSGPSGSPRADRLRQSQPCRIRRSTARGTLRSTASPPGGCSTATISATGRTVCRSSPTR